MRIRITRIKNNNHINLLFWLLGFSSTAPLLSFPVAGRLISLYTVMLCFVLIYLFFKQNNNQSIKTTLDKKYYQWSAFGIASSIFGFLFFWGMDEWMETSLSYIPKIALYVVLFFLIRNSKCCYDYCRSICYGILGGFIINIGWAIVDAFLFYITGVSITNELFAYYIAISDIRYGIISLTIGGTIRSCGLNIDPANIGLFAPIVALYGLYTKRYVLYGLSFISILASLSHTAFVSIVIVTFYYFFFVNKKRILSLVGLSLIVVAVVALLSVVEVDALKQMQEAFVERTEEKASGNEIEGDRGRYWVNFIPAAFHQPTALIIGTGYFTASYPYLTNNLVDHEPFPYDPEQTFFSMYFDIGLIGLIIYLSILIGIYKCSKKLMKMEEDRQYMITNAGIIGSSVAALGYHYTLYSVIMLFLICGIVQYSFYINKYKKTSNKKI